VGEDCAGLGTFGLIVKHVNMNSLNFKHVKTVFASEHDAALFRYLEKKGHHTKVDLDMTLREVQDTPVVNLYAAGCPCQPESSMGNRRRARDPRSAPLRRVVELLTSDRRPAVFIMENVVNVRRGTGRKRFSTLIRRLEKLFTVFVKDLNSAEFGLPQHRPRTYIVGFSKNIAADMFAWPAVQRPTSIRTILIDLPWVMPPQTSTAMRNRSFALSSLASRPVGTMCVVDMGASRQRPVAMIDASPCLTRARSHGSRLWLAQNVAGGVRWRPLDVLELSRLQGFPDAVAKEILGPGGLTVNQFKLALGNAFSFPVMAAVVRQVLTCLKAQ
jgi:site-specific DNA-cytosine methylase